MALSIRKRREARDFYQRRLVHHLNSGKSPAAARKAADADGREKFGVDWPALLETLRPWIELLITLLLKK